MNSEREGIEPNSLEFWEAVSHDYEAAQDFRDRPAEYRRIGTLVQSWEPVLEIGSAFGMLTKYLVPDTHYLGMELSPSMVAKARAIFPGRAFICMDFMKAGPEWEGVFATAIVGQLLEHFPDLATPINQIKKLVRDRMVFSVPRGKITDPVTSFRSDGHILSWENEKALASDLEPFGKVEFFSGEKNHICGVLSLNGHRPFIPNLPIMPIHRAP